MAPTSPPPDAAAPPKAPKASRRFLLVAVTVGFAIALLSSSLKNTVSAFYVSMADSFDVTRGGFALAPSLFMLTYAIASPLMGWAADRIGARRALTGGLALGAVLFAAAGIATSFGLFTVLYGVGFAVAYTSISYVPLGVLADEMFPPERRGLAYAVLMNGTAVGFITLLPLWIALDDGERWRTVFLVLGAVTALLAVLAFMLLPGAPRSVAAQTGTAGGGGLAKVLRSKVFWVVSGAFFGCGITMGFVDVHLVAHLDLMGMGQAVAGTTVALLGAAEIAGALLAGYLCDRGHAVKVLAGSYLLRCLSLVILAAFPTAFAAGVFGLLFGLTYLGTVIAGSMLLLDGLDARTKGLALGLMWFVHQIGAFAVSEAGGISYDTLRTYEPVVVASAGIAAVSCLLVAGFRRSLASPDKALEEAGRAR
ncbi:MFS transporter [Streptomyces sp. P17]|uniref:MFS transporter n=1 Tax=Streptomyces sp. P17 TaxID=3074716 RepID=UPI0028F3EE62|nr:MFS transporter [Streptomyces sp. P17]MDT9698128.1 MFS transporter [Streptomyces sp. P17]